MNFVSQIKKIVFRKHKWSSMTKSALTIGLMSGSAQSMENKNTNLQILEIQNCPELPPEVLVKLWDYIDDNRSNLELICKDWLKAGIAYYEQKNDNLAYATWEDWNLENSYHFLEPKIIFISIDLYSSLLKHHTFDLDHPMKKDLFDYKCQKLLSLPQLSIESEAHQKFSIIQGMGADATPECFNDTGWALHIKKEHNTAAYFLIVALEMAGETAEVWDFTLVYKVLTEVGKHEKANKYMNKAFQRVRSLIDKDEILDGLDTISSAFCQTKNYTESSNVFKMIIETKGENTAKEDYLNLFLSLIKMKEFDAAKEYINVITDGTENYDYSYDIRDSAEAFRKVGLYDKARHFGILAIKKAGDSLDQWYYISLAKTLTKMNNHDEADRCINMGMELAMQEGNSHEALEYIANFLIKAGRLEEAAKYEDMNS